MVTVRLKEAFLDVARDLDAYLADPKLPPLLWLRLHVGRRLTTLHRQHLGTKMRDAGMEISLYRDALPEASSAALASMLLGSSPSAIAAASGPGSPARHRARPDGLRAIAAGGGLRAVIRQAARQGRG
ncbi:MAG: hypothetical protein ACHRXM_24230 [Isosphaerales bacterium]